MEPSPVQCTYIAGERGMNTFFLPPSLSLSLSHGDQANRGRKSQTPLFNENEAQGLLQAAYREAMFQPVLGAEIFDAGRRRHPLLAQKSCRKRWGCSVGGILKSPKSVIMACETSEIADRLLEFSKPFCCEDPRDHWLLHRRHVRRPGLFRQGAHQGRSRR
jgi:hypothetical protein